MYHNANRFEYYRADPTIYTKLEALARLNRQKPTAAEKRLRKALKGKKLEGLSSYAERTLRLEAMGFRVIRFSNEEVLEKIERVMERILEALSEVYRGRSPSPAPSRGEGVH